MAEPARRPPVENSEALVKLPPVPPELFIVPTIHVAEHAGFRNGRHRQLLHLHVWWPGAGIRLLHAAPYWRITVDSGVRRHLYEVGTRQERDHWDEAQAILRARQQVFGDNAIWMEF